MYGEEIEYGISQSAAMQMLEEINQLVQQRREAAKRAEQARLDQVANMIGNLAVPNRRPGFVQN
jgi:2,4-dienoyl-CoA reductase-like NADH-dependent reductase (Old Yellow Enzyme family)